MIRWLGLWRPVWGRLRSDWPFLLAVWLLIVSATTLLTAGTLYAETVEIGGVRRALAEAAPAARGVSVRLNASVGELEQFDPPIRAELGRAFGEAGAEVTRSIRSASLALIEQSGGEGPRRLAVLGAYEGLADHAELVAGAWPQAGAQPPQAVVSEGAAEALGVAVGDRVGLADAATPGADPNVAVAEVVVVGVYAVDRDEPFWLGEAIEIDGFEQRGALVLGGPLMVDPADVGAVAAFSRSDVIWRSLPRVQGLRVQQLDGTRARLLGLPRSIESILPAGRFVAVSNELANVLGGIDRSALVSRSGVVLITLQFGILAGYAVLLVGGILAERRRAEVALLRARGASTTEVGLIAAGEAALLGVSAAVLAPLISIVVVEAIGNWGALGESGIIAGAAMGQPTLLVALAAGAVCVVALTVPALLAEVDLARVRAALGRPLAQTAAQRLGLDLVLLTLAAIGIFQLRSYGATVTPTTGGRLELDPLLVAAPAISLAAGAILVVRFVPRLGEVAEWLLRRGRGMLPPYTARQAARRPLRYTRSALLIVLAAALGTFGALYSATWTQSQSDQATYQTGADMRVMRAQHGASRAGEIASELAALPGVEGVAPLIRAQVDVGRAVRRANLLAVEPETLVAVADFPADSGVAIAGLLDELVVERPVPAAINLPAGSLRLAVVVDAAFQEAPGGHGLPVDWATWPGVTVTPIVDVGGREAIRLETARGVFQAAGQRLIFDLGPALELAPQSGEPADLRLVALEMTLAGPGSAVGEFRLDRIEASPSAAGQDWNTVVTAIGVPWSIVYHRSQSAGPGRPLGGARTHDYGGPEVRYAGREILFRCGVWTSSGTGCEDPFPDIYRWSARQQLPPLAAIASGPFLAGTGTRVGDTLDVDWFDRLHVQIVGTVGEFPSLDPASPFLIVDWASINRLRAERQLERAEPTEWWLTVADEARTDVEAAARRSPISAADVISSTALTRTLQRDPIALGLVGALLLGSLSAAAFAGLGLLVTAVVSARERVGEIALMRALGVSGRQILSLLSVEHVLLLGLGLLAGAGLGVLIAVLVLPHAPLNRSGAAVVPSPQIVVPWELLGLVAAGALVVVALSVLAANREIVGRPVVDVLRERED